MIKAHTYRSGNSAHLRKANLFVGRAPFKQTHTTIKPNRQPRGPDWAKALPLDKNRPVPIIPARAIIDKLCWSWPVSNCRLGASVKYDPLAFLQATFRTSISERRIYNGLWKGLWIDPPVHVIWRFISWHFLICISHPGWQGSSLKTWLRVG